MHTCNLSTFCVQVCYYTQTVDSTKENILLAHKVNIPKSTVDAGEGVEAGTPWPPNLEVSEQFSSLATIAFMVLISIFSKSRNIFSAPPPHTPPLSDHILGSLHLKYIWFLTAPVPLPLYAYIVVVPTVSQAKSRNIFLTPSPLPIYPTISWVHYCYWFPIAPVPLPLYAYIVVIRHWRVNTSRGRELLP